MKIFLSSLIAGFEDYRASAVAAITSLGHEPVMAEDFTASASSPRIACLDGVRRSDLVVLILSGSYGVVQPASGLSATHEEYREAKDNRPVIAFVQEGVAREPAQVEFVREVQDWSGGLFRGGFRSAEELRSLMTKAIHQFELSAAAAPVDANEMLVRAIELIPEEDRHFRRAQGPVLHLAVVGGPAQAILRPVEIERPEFARTLLREATYGDNSFFDPVHGSNQAVRDGTLALTQESGAGLTIDERGSILISVPIAKGSGMMGVLIEENVATAVSIALAHSAEVLAKIDETQLLSRVVLVAAIAANGAMGWRTRREDDASPNSFSMSHGFDRSERATVHFQPADKTRAALSFDRARMAEDLAALLKRQWQ